MILFGTLRNEKTRKIISHLKYFPNAIKDLYRVAELIYDLPHITSNLARVREVITPMHGEIFTF